MRRIHLIIISALVVLIAGIGVYFVIFQKKERVPEGPPLTKEEKVKLSEVEKKFKREQKEEKEVITPLREEVFLRIGKVVAKEGNTLYLEAVDLERNNPDLTGDIETEILKVKAGERTEIIRLAEVVAPPGGMESEEIGPGGVEPGEMEPGGMEPGFGPLFLGGPLGGPLDGSLEDTKVDFEDINVGDEIQITTREDLRGKKEIEAGKIEIL